MVIKRTPHNKNLLIAVLVFLLVTGSMCLSLLHFYSNIPIRRITVETVKPVEPPIAVPLLPPSKVEVIRHKPTIPPIEIVTFTPTQIIPDHPEPPPAPDYFHT